MRISVGSITRLSCPTESANPATLCGSTVGLGNEVFSASLCHWKNVFQSNPHGFPHDHAVWTFTTDCPVLPQIQMGSVPFRVCPT